MVRIAEGKPWEATNSDGSPNYGSYSYGASLSMAELAHDIIHEAGFTLDREKVRNLGAALALIADSAQAAIRTDGASDRMDGSHSRARGAVRSSLLSCPPPWGGEESAWHDWKVRLTNRTVALLRIGDDIDNNNYPPEPWTAMAGFGAASDRRDGAPTETVKEDRPDAGSTLDVPTQPDLNTGERMPLTDAVAYITEIADGLFPAHTVETKVKVFTGMLDVDKDSTVNSGQVDHIIENMEHLIPGSAIAAPEKDPVSV